MRVYPYLALRAALALVQPRASGGPRMLTAARAVAGRVGGSFRGPAAGG